MEIEKNKGRSEGGRKTSEGGRGDPEKASPSAVERYLKGMHYPVQKEALLKKAQENNAPADVIKVLNRFEDKNYQSPIDVAKEMGRV